MAGHHLQFELCESLAEVRFGVALRDALAGSPARLIQQKRYSVLKTEFRADFALEMDGHRDLIIEIDGREFHDIERDFIRDALLISTKDVFVIVRIAAFDAINFPRASVGAVAERHKHFFAENALDHLAGAIAARCVRVRSFSRVQNLKGVQGLVARCHGLKTLLQVARQADVKAREKSDSLNLSSFVMPSTRMNRTPVAMPSTRME